MSKPDQSENHREIRAAPATAGPGAPSKSKPSTANPGPPRSTMVAAAAPSLTPLERADALLGALRDVVIEPGPVEVCAGSSSSDIRSSAKFTVTGKTRPIKGEDRAFLSVTTVGS